MGKLGRAWVGAWGAWGAWVVVVVMMWWRGGGHYLGEPVIGGSWLGDGEVIYALPYLFFEFSGLVFYSQKEHISMLKHVFS